MFFKLLLFIVIIALAFVTYKDQKKQNNEHIRIKKSIEKNRNELEERLKELLDKNNNKDMSKKIEETITPQIKKIVEEKIKELNNTEISPIREKIKGIDQDIIIEKINKMVKDDMQKMKDSDIDPIKQKVNETQENSIKTKDEMSKKIENILNDVNYKISQLLLGFKESETTPMKNEMSNMKNDTNSIKNDTNNMKNDITNLRNDITNLRNDITNLRTDLTGKVNDLINWKTSQTNQTDTIVKNRFCINSTCFTKEQLLKSLKLTNRLVSSGGPIWSQQYSNATQVIVGDNEKAHVIIVGRSNAWSTGEIIAERKEGNNYVVKSRIPWSKVHYTNHNPMIFVPPGETWRIRNTSNGSRWIQVYRY